MLLMELEAEPAPCPSLKRILSAGEALTTSLANQVRQERNSLCTPSPHA
jgi:hypothetical protein